MEHNLYICIYVKDILVLAVHMWSGHVIGPSAIMWVLVFRTVFTLSSTNNSSCTRICSPAAMLCEGSLPDQRDHFNKIGAGVKWRSSKVRSLLPARALAASPTKGSPSPRPLLTEEQ